MAMRRPRIKPVANILLNSKRKPKAANDVKVGNAGESDAKNLEEKDKQIKLVIQEKETSSNDANLLEVRNESPYDPIASLSNLNSDKDDCDTNSQGRIDLQKVDTKTELSSEPINKNEKIVMKIQDSTKNTNECLSKTSYIEAKENIKDSEAFKCPPKVVLQRAVSHTSNSGLDDVFYSDIEENALQMDLEKSNSNCPLSPSKNLARPRIRPTPHFGQRRNSYVGSSPSPHTSATEDNPLLPGVANNDVLQTAQTRRERHHSASISGHSSLHHHTAHKYLSAGITNNTIGRIRTESGCSVFSDNNTSSHKFRKIDDHKQSARKDYEARFHNGVPEKSVIKMSDLIFYNPATNPMEQKPAPNVKLEQKENVLSDVKPVIEKSDIDASISFDADAEAVPVPQLKLNAKGELILDDKSLVIETTAEQEARKALANSSLIYLDEYTGMNGFYKRKSRTRVWLPSDTIKFYRCLQNVGTDFSLMVSLFPNRTRRDLKLKFKKEERKNGNLINKALLYPKQFDLEALKQQIEEEEKLRVEQVKDKKKKPKKEKKKINCQSKANRVLVSTVYQNENNTDESNKDKMDDDPQIEETIRIDSVKKSEHKEDEKKTKIKVKKSKKPAKILSEVDKLLQDYELEKRKRDRFYAIKRRRKRRHRKRQMREEMTFIKEEIKSESKQESNESELQDSKQLQMEMDDLLDMDAVDTQYSSDTYGTSTSNILNSNHQLEQYNEQTDTTKQAVSQATPFPHKTATENKEETELYEHKTFFNLDDGSLSIYSNMKDDIVFISPAARSPPQHSISVSPSIENPNNSFAAATSETETVNPETGSSVTSECDLNEADIQSILTELAEGSLVLVSSLDPDDPDKVLNEIYMVDKNTGDLCDEPLSIPDNIVQCILTVAS